MNETYTPQELLAACLMRIASDAESIAVYNTMPIPAVAALALYEKRQGDLVLSILGSFRYNKLFTGGIREQYDFSAKGRIDLQFFSGGQIDGKANINLVGVGGYPVSRVRFAGSFGSALQYYTGRRTILFREEHTRRVFVPEVDFVSAPGVSAEGVYRPGGPVALVTSLCVMRFDQNNVRFILESVHPGYSVEDVVNNTGFEFEYSSSVKETSPPSDEELSLLRGFARREVAEVYPNFAASCLLPRKR